MLVGESRLNLQRLDPDETRQLLEVADDVVGDGGRTVAVAAYGSKVAGYEGETRTTTLSWWRRRSRGG